MSGSKALKHYFDAGLARLLADRIAPHAPSFPAEAFVRSVADKVESLELKGRVAVIAEALRDALPTDYPEALDILLRTLGPENETEQGMFTNGYHLMPVAYFVERYGLPHFPLSMHALYKITKRHTSEYAIRPYLVYNEEESIRMLNRWALDANAHVRRLVSEGTRPRLPWAKRISPLRGDPAWNLALLEPLLDDPSPYVRKSVANHLNDLTKDYREVMIGWLGERRDRGGAHFAWIVRHGFRSLIKAGDREAILLLERLQSQGTAGREQEHE